MHEIAGMPVIISDEIGKKTEYYQYKFPRSKKKRIRKKWATNKKYWKTRVWWEYCSFVMNGKIYTNQITFYKLKEKIKNNA